MAKKADRPDWWGLHPADMTSEQMGQARDWFNQRHAAMVDRAQRFDDARRFLDQALLERLGVAHEPTVGPGNPAPTYPDLADEDMV